MLSQFFRHSSGRPPVKSIRGGARPIQRRSKNLKPAQQNNGGFGHGEKILAPLCRRSF